MAVLADAVSWVLAETYDPVRQTISSLAVGPSSWLIDLGLWTFAAACFAIGTGMLSLRIPARLWVFAAAAVLMMGEAVAVVSAVNEYAGARNAGADLHRWAVGGLYLCFSVAALGALSGLRDLDRRLARYSRLSGWAWVVLGPIYVAWAPRSWAGAFERGLALLVVAWLALMGWQLLREARRYESRSA